MKTLKTTLLSTALLAVIVSPAFAVEGTKNKEVTSLVGYNVTEKVTYAGPKAETYNQMDANSDGTVTFKEYSHFSTLDNEYDAFVRMDTDHSKNLSIDEFVNANLIKGNTQIESQMFGKAPVKGTNLVTRAQVQKNYYVPVEPKVVDVKNIEPAASRSNY